MELAVKGGVIKYSLPNYAQAWRLRSAIGVMPKGYDAQSWGIAAIADHIGDFIDTSAVTLEEGAAPVLENPDYADAITEIIGKIVIRAVEFYPSKKQTSKK